MRILLHNSHHQTGLPDGWSGAPGEATWVMALNSRVESGLKAKGVTVVRVDGDLRDHPEFHTDYDAFIAPHYEADVHGTGGSFWGRAAQSPTASQDDRLGGMFWTRFRALQGAPPPRFDWSNPNVTDYYGFRLTSAKTPGILVEHGVGWGADKAWLRDNIAAIAKVWIDTLIEFGGGPVLAKLDDEDKKWMLENIVKPLSTKMDSGFNTSITTFIDRLAAGDTKVETAAVDKGVPPVPQGAPAGATYFGMSADGQTVGWNYPDGTTHWYINGVEKK